MTKLSYTMLISFMGNIVLSTVKIIVGFICRSTSLVADGMHTFSDLSTDLITISSDRLEENQKGFERIVNIFMGCVIIVLGLLIIRVSTIRDIVIPPVWTVFISLGTIICKYLLSSYVMERGIDYNNSTLVNCAKESDRDVISSLIVFLGLAIMQLSNKYQYLAYTEIVVTIIVSLFVIYTGFDIIRQEINNVFGKEDDCSEDIDKIKDLILLNKNVRTVDKIKVIRYGMYYELKSTIGLDSNLSLKEAHEIARQVEKTVKKYYPKMYYIIIHIDPV